MKFFSDMDDGFYYVVFFIALFIFLGFIILSPSTAEEMAKNGYVEKIEIVNTQQFQKVWVKEK